jgi:hypothetical protein
MEKDAEQIEEKSNSIFKDPKYEEMDWIGRIAEPIESSKNWLLSQLPDEILIDIANCENRLSPNVRLSTESVLDPLLRRHGSFNKDWNDIYKCFEFQASHDAKIDFRQSPPAITGTVALVKSKKAFEEQELIKSFGQNGVAEIRSARWSYGNGSLSRMNEVAEILECPPEIHKTKSAYKKINHISRQYAELLRTNKWRIKDEGLATSIGQWIAEYIENGALHAFTNLCKVKVMTYSENPIYSIEEEK